MQVDKVKAAKVATGKTKKPKVDPGHPPFSEMVLNVLKNHKQRNGHSKISVAKLINEKYPKAGTVKEIAGKVGAAFKRLIKSKTLVNTKGIGAGGSVKIAQGVAEAKKGGVKKAKAKKATTGVKKAKPAKKTGAKKPKTAGKAKVAKVAKPKPVEGAAETKQTEVPKPKIEKAKPAASKPKAAAKPKAAKRQTPKRTTPKAKTPKVKTPGKAKTPKSAKAAGKPKAVKKPAKKAGGSK